MQQKQPLTNRRIVLTRAQHQMREFAERLQALGAEPLFCPAIQIVPPADWSAFDHALANLDQFDWLMLTSANAVLALIERMHINEIPNRALHLPIAAIGKATAKRLREAGLHVDFMPSQSVAEALLNEFGDIQGKRILLPQADLARPVLIDGLRERGATVTPLVAYHTVADPALLHIKHLLDANTIDAITFTSASTVQYTVELLQTTGLDHGQTAALLNQTNLVSIGPITSQAAQDLGLHVAAEASEHNTDGLITALLSLFDAQHPEP